MAEKRRKMHVDLLHPKLYVQGNMHYSTGNIKLIFRVKHDLMEQERTPLTYNLLIKLNQ